MSSASQSLEQAIQLHRDGNLQAARELYEQILATEPRHAQAMSLLGLLVGQAGDWPGGVEQMQRAIHIDASQPALLVNLAEGHRALGQLAEAEGWYRRALAVTPTAPELHNAIATLLDQQGRVDEAIAAYREAIRLNPQYAEAHYNLATAFQRARNSVESECAPSTRVAVAARSTWPR